jgi:tetratricopeptide (TPR) repeat protein
MVRWPKGAARVALVGACGAARAAAGAASSEELVLQARAHEAAHEEDIALRRYTEAIEVDSTNGAAWTGLGELRFRLGEPAEAERVFTAALQRDPHLHRALLGRARARWALGEHARAEMDLEAYANTRRDSDAYRELAAWFGVDGRTPAELATWRRLLAAATREGDAAAIDEARRMVRSLVILVDGADPAACPADSDSTRRALARIARRAP